jgi:hypothetical protein
MRLLNKISIRNKLISIILLVSTFSLLVGFTVVILNDIKTFKSDLAQSMVTTTRIIGDYSVTDLAFKDKEASQKTLAELAGIASVEAAYLFDIDGKLFSYYVREGSAREVPSVRKASAEFSIVF